MKHTKSKLIFTVTTLSLKDKRSRTVGYFFTLKKAQQCVEENWGSIYELGWYPEAIIEKIEEGLYPSPFEHEQYFYRWEGDVENGGYKPCDKFGGSEELIGYCSMG